LNATNLPRGLQIKQHNQLLAMLASNTTTTNKIKQTSFAYSISQNDESFSLFSLKANKTKQNKTNQNW
jgi:type III secretory pathway lipoprotein EscJ